jgi:GntR family uxuAB operon transcriptional repressor
LIDARFALEPHICRLAVLHGKKEQFQKLETLVEAMAKSVKDPTQFASADTAFHQVLADCTGNNLLIWIINQINSVRGQDEWTKARHLTLNDNIIRTYNIQHNQILLAIKSREPEKAASFMKEHLEIARLSLTRAAGT